jgi:hypothetical protein
VCKSGLGCVRLGARLSDMNGCQRSGQCRAVPVRREKSVISANEKGQFADVLDQ